MYLVFDTETTGLPKNWNAPITDTDNWPRCIQLAWQLHDGDGRLLEHKDFLIRPEGFNIPFEAEQVHGISTELATAEGIPLEEALAEFNAALRKATFVVGQNIDFDINVVGCEFIRHRGASPLTEVPILDTCTEKTAARCRLPGGRGGKFKLPTLTELHQHLFGVPFAEAHNATADVEATARCFFELIRVRNFTAQELRISDHDLEDFVKKHPLPIPSIGRKHVNLKEKSADLRQRHKRGEEDDKQGAENLTSLDGVPFSHLHNRSQFSVLQSTTRIRELVKKAGEMGCPAVALTDSGNMMAAFQFVREVDAYNDTLLGQQGKSKGKGESPNAAPLLPIVGCAFNVCADHLDKSTKDKGRQVVLLAKNKTGYNNLVKMASIAFTQGFYYVPRIDRTLVTHHKEGIIALTGGMTGEIPSLILNVGEHQAETALKWWKEQFGDDLYLELMRHGLAEEDEVNATLLKFHRKYGVKLVATNDTRYLHQSDAEAHDILLCIKDGELKSTPIGKGRGYRYGLPNPSYYFKSPDEMKQLFADVPSAIENTNEIASKCTPYTLARDILLPAFTIPEVFKDTADQEDGGKRGENNYLRHLAFEGAKERYGTITPEIKERIDFELTTIAKTGYPGYFLIVQDLCRAAREMDVVVGPGRGSAAGSVVAYCTGITNIDPIRYQLLFERFLNPDRISMPDIDIDFDDEGRQRVIEWVIDKYGAHQVAQIMTYGTMAAKSAIRDTARVLDLPLHEADKLAKLVPDNIPLSLIFQSGSTALADALKNNQDNIQRAKTLKKIAKGNDLQSKVIHQALVLEGSLRNTGIHACGVIITPSDITDFVPVALSKDADMYCTQFDNAVAEDAGLLKMDFLGLKTLTLIKDAINIVKERQGVDLDADHFPLDDEKTYALFQRGETIGIFQYESVGMQRYLRELKPTAFEDLIAMNALYRPGPLEYIPSFIRRKHGTEEIVYDLEDAREYLEETYGITVYQEQVMLLSQKLAGFSRGEADTLRKAMGKKKFALLAKMKPQFLEQGVKNGHSQKVMEKIWSDWEAFASYAFNKSHSTCYAWIAYQTAYLKANYTAEYMASALSNNMNDTRKLTLFMEECKRLGIAVLGPDVNESQYKFTVNEEGAIRFGFGAIKGMGHKPAEALLKERNENGRFTSIFDVTTRVDLRLCNKRVFESLVLAGGFDSFGSVTREQFFAEDTNKKKFLENAIKFGARIQENKNAVQLSLFGDSLSETAVLQPQPPKAAPWSALTKLNKEKEIVGVYISGHPLDDFKLDIRSFCNALVSDIVQLDKFNNRELRIAGIITDAQHRTTKHGHPFGKFEIEDYTDNQPLFLFGEDYMKFKHLLSPGTFVHLTGRVQKKRFEEALEFKVTHMELLTEIRGKRAQTLQLSIACSDITDHLIDDIYHLVQNHSGSCALRFIVKDEPSNTRLRMPSRTLKVAVDNALIQQIEALKVVDYALE